MTHLDYMDDLMDTCGTQGTSGPCSLLILSVHIVM